jgi:hypothetical protein
MNKILRTAFVLALFACASLLLIAPASAQSVYGSIFGTVTDKTGAAVSGATITVKDEAKGTVITITSNSAGDYSAAHLVPDVYDIKVTAKGFKSFETKGITVQADTAPRIDPTLEVGGGSETVTVSADEQPQLKTDRADVSTVFDQQQISSLPVGDQNFTNLQLLLPGAQLLGWSHAADENPQGSKLIMVNGQAFSGTAFELDGTDNQDPILGIIVINPAMDAVTETKITTQNFDAELGKAVSAVVTAQTRSGTNSFHGSAYDFRTSNANLARDPFSQAPGPDAIAGGIKNRIGGSIGGPVLKNKAFFFGNYEGQRQRTGTTVTSTLPTNNLVESCISGSGCDFSEYAAASGLGDKGKVYDWANTYKDANGNTRPTQFAGNIIPTARISSQALAFLKYLEPYTKGIALGNSGNLNGLDTNYHGSGTGMVNTDSWTARGDYNVNDKAHAFGRFSRFTSTLKGTPAFGAAGGSGFGVNNFAGNAKGANDSLAAGMDIAFNSKLLMDVRLGYYRYNVNNTKYDQSTTFATTLGIPGLNLGTFFTGGSPGFTIDTLAGGSTQPNFGDGLNINRCNCPLTEREDQGQVANNWTKILGNHSIKVGADLRYARNLRVPSDNNRTGLLYFNTGPTSDPANTTAAGGLGFATLMLGEVTKIDRYVSTSTNAKEFQKRTFFYGQDTWRARRDLTVNIGLRWELYFPEKVNGAGNGSLLDLSDGYLRVAGKGSIGTNMNYDIQKMQMFAPRLGLTYQLDPKTVIRAGYGRSFDIGIFGSIFGHAATQNLPVLTNQEINQPSTTQQAFSLSTGPASAATVNVPANGLLPNPGYSVSSRARPNPLRFPEIDAWNLSVQRALTPNLTLTMAYVGTKGTYTQGDGVGNTSNPNEAAINLPGSLSKTGQALHWDPSVAANTISSSGGTSTYNDLRRYYGSSLKACNDSNYMSISDLRTQTGDSTLQAGMCGWTNDVQYYSDNFSTEFNALQVTLAQQAWKGLSYTANYQWASAFAPTTSYSTWAKGATVRGRDSNVRRQQLTWYGSYDLPLGKGKQYVPGANRITDLIIGGYQLSGVVNWSGGLPFTLNYSETSNNIPSSAPSYPSYTGNGARMKTNLTGFQGKNGTGSRKYYVKQTTNLITDTGTGIFKNPGLDTIGNVGRNTYTGPTFFNTDLAITKAFTIHENIVTKFRMDAFNAFNHINPGNPGGNIESDGNITSEATAGSPRQLEFSLRVQF